MSGLREIIRSVFSNAWQLNDLAHRENHFIEVERCGLHINETLGLGFDPELIMMAAYFHDLFAWSRYNHHQLSAKWVRTTDFQPIVDLSNVDREYLAQACAHHRASRDPSLKFPSKFAELINSADRGMPGDVDSMLERAIAYRTSKGGDPATNRADSIAHLKEKFGTNGYASYPQMYIDVFGEQLMMQRQEIDNL